MTVIGAWIDAAAARGAGAAYLEEAGGAAKLTFGGLRGVTRAMARRLDLAGIPPGGRVAVRLPDPLGYASALVAIIAAGRIAVPLDPAAPAASLGRLLDVAQPEAMVGDGSGLPAGLTVLGAPAPDEAGGAPARSGGGIFLCTSGSTGTPKGVLLGADQLGHVAACVAQHHRLGPADRGYCSLPLFHVNAEVVGLLATLAAGACLVLDGRFSRRRFWATMQTQRITWINAVPAIITVLAMEPPAVRPSGRVRFVRSASAPLAPSVLRRFEEAFGIPVVETYGMTEAASMITANPLDGPRKAGSAGLPAGAEVRVVRPAGPRDVPCPAGPRYVPCPADPRYVPCPADPRYVPCPAFAVGRVQIRGRGVITQYAAGGPAGAIDRDGWLDTGDLGHVDSDGYLFLAGRSDDVINRGGEKIYPREIEDVLLAQPGVRFAAVVAASDQVLGERPVAYVVPARPGPRQPVEDALFEEAPLEEAPLEEALFEEALFEDALREACEAALPRPKRPAAFHLVPELPVGPTGKVARRRLRELAAARE